MVLPIEIEQFMRSFKKNNFDIYVVGGAIRNLLLGKPSNNWDFTTNATPEQMLSLFPDAFYHNTYGTVTVPYKNKEINLLFEVTPYRKEGNYKDNRHPTTIVWAKTLQEDLSRRDFTINAIAYDGIQIIDLFQGVQHLQNKIIVAVGNPDTRFQEDALRLMRGIRLASELGFLIEDKTRIAIVNNASLVQNISGERIRDELLKILASPHPAEGILFLRSTGLLKYILPELDVCFAIPQKSPKRHHIYDVGTHCVMSLKYCPSSDPITRFATLIHDIGKATTYRRDENGLITFYNHEVAGTELSRQITKRLRLSNAQSDKLIRLVMHHQFTVSEVITDKAVRRFIRDVGLEYVDDMLALRTGDRLGSGATATSWRFDLFKKRIVEVQKEPFTVKDLKINGYDVMKQLSIQPGPRIGTILDDLFSKVEEKKLPNVREVLLKELDVYAE